MLRWSLVKKGAWAQRRGTRPSQWWAQEVGTPASLGQTRREIPVKQEWRHSCRLCEENIRSNGMRCSRRIAVLIPTNVRLCEPGRSTSSLSPAYPPPAVPALCPNLEVHLIAIAGPMSTNNSHLSSLKCAKWGPSWGLCICYLSFHLSHCCPESLLSQILFRICHFSAVVLNLGCTLETLREP